jgi:hypothetical protein
MMMELYSVNNYSTIKGSHMKTIIIFLMSLTFFTSLAHAVPNTFSVGETVSASKMNQNFNALENAIGSAISEVTFITRYTAINYGTSYGSSGSEVATASCAADEVITGASCSCLTTGANFSVTNFGQVAYCDIAGDSVVGSCSANSLVYINGLYGPPITVYARCAKVTDTASPSASLSPAQETELFDLQDRIAEQMDILNTRVKK